jgi:hypothetical protein
LIGERPKPILTDDVRRTVLTSMLFVLAIAPAAARAQPSTARTVEIVPEPPSPAARDVGDDELLRWASNEVRIYEGRPLAPPRPPGPPDSYFGTGADGVLTLPDQSARDATRVLAELGGGALGALVGGGLATLMVWGAMEERASTEWMMVAVGAGAALTTVGVTGGVVLAGDAAGGHGNIGDTFIGELIGSAVAVPLITIGIDNDAPVLAFVAAGVLPLAGAILGYELSHANSESAAAPRQIAFLSPTYGGAVAGVRGTLP